MKAIMNEVTRRLASLKIGKSSQENVGKKVEEILQINKTAVNKAYEDAGFAANNLTSFLVQNQIAQRA